MTSIIGVNDPYAYSNPKGPGFTPNSSGSVQLNPKFDSNQYASSEQEGPRMPPPLSPLRPGGFNQSPPTVAPCGGPRDD